MTTTRDLIEQRFLEATAEKEALYASVKPAQDELDAAAAEFEQARLKWQAAKERLIPQLEKQKIAELSQEITQLASALGGKLMSQG